MRLRLFLGWLMWTLALAGLAAACGAPSAPATPTLVPSPTFTPTPTLTPTPTPTPIPGLITDSEKIGEILYASFTADTPESLPENRDAMHSNDVLVLHYAQGGDAEQLVPKRIFNANLYQNSFRTLDMRSLREDFNVMLVEMVDESGNEYYVPLEVLRHEMGDEYAESLLSALYRHDMTFYPTMPSQLMLIATGMEGVAPNAEEHVGVIAGSLDNPVKVSVLPKDLIVLGRYDPDMPDDDPSDDLLLAVQPLGGEDIQNSQAQYPLSDFVILNPEDLGMGSSLASLPDMTSAYQDIMAIWWGGFLGGIVESYDRQWDWRHPNDGTLASLLSPLPMASRIDEVVVDLINKKVEFEKPKTGWVYDIHLTPINNTFIEERNGRRVEDHPMREHVFTDVGSESAMVVLNYGKDGPVVALPLQPEMTIFHDSDMVIKPAGLNPMADASLRDRERFFPYWGKGLFFDFTSPLFASMHVAAAVFDNGARNLLGIPPYEIEVVHDTWWHGMTGIPTVKWNGQPLYFAASDFYIVPTMEAFSRGNYSKFGDSLAFYNSLYQGPVKVTLLDDIPFDHQVVVGLDPAELEKVGVVFKHVENFDLSDIPSDEPVIAQFSTGNLHYQDGLDDFQDLTNYANSDVKWLSTSTRERVGSFVRRVLEHIVGGMAKADDGAEGKIPYALVDFNSPAFSPILNIAQYVLDNDANIGVSGSFSDSEIDPKTVKEIGSGDWKTFIYNAYYIPLSEGKLFEPQNKYRDAFDYMEETFSWIEEREGLWRLDLPTKYYHIMRFDGSGDFGNTSRKFHISGDYWKTEPYRIDIGFKLFNITDKQGHLPPWLIPGAVERGDFDIYYPIYSGFEKYK